MKKPDRHVFLRAFHTTAYFHKDSSVWVAGCHSDGLRAIPALCRLLKECSYRLLRWSFSTSSTILPSRRIDGCRLGDSGNQHDQQSEAAIAQIHETSCSRP
jgi:hypothetical protein